MNHLKILVLLFWSITTFAQIKITSPLLKAVYQRNGLNTHDLTVTGSYNYPIVTSIQVRLKHVSNQEVVAGFDWKTIAKNPATGHFEGSIKNVPGGWYRLEVRALKSGLVLDTSSVDKFGIGDVYMIAGQSNAHGFHDWTPPNYYPVGLGSNDERVVSVDYQLYCRDEPLPFPALTQIRDQTRMAPNGKAAWYWGAVGEALVDSLGIPVAFFNAAASGSSTQNWVESIQNLPTMGVFRDSLVCATFEENQGLPYDTVGAPYYNLKRGLNYYNSMFGVKSVLWHQGESDNILGVTTSQYASNLNYIINQTRNDFDPNLSWMIARASYADYKVSSAVVDAQNLVISPPNNIFSGPATDWLNNSYLSDSRDWLDLHFTKNIGFPFVVAGWSGFLSSSGFQQDAEPIVPVHIPPVDIKIISENSVQLSVPNLYSQYKWIRVDLSNNTNYEGTVSEGNTHTLTKAVGVYRCWVKLPNGNLQVSASVDIQNILNLNFNSNSCTGDQYLSDLKYTSSSNGLGPLEINYINGGEGDGDGASIYLKGQMYAKGLGVAGNSVVEYNLPEFSFYKFSAKVGFSDDVNTSCNSTGVRFKVYADEEELYTSDVVLRSSPVVNINLGIYGKKKLKLVTETLATNSCNRFVWADVVLKCNPGDTIAPTTPTLLSISDTLTKCATLAWGPSSDSVGVWKYEIFKGGVALDTVDATIVNYRFINLNRNDSVMVGVRAIDYMGNKSGIASILLKTYDLKFAYPSAGAFCVGDTVMPLHVIPNLGKFSAASSNLELDSLSGAFRAASSGTYVVIYKLNTIEFGCVDEKRDTVTTVLKPAKPVLTSSTDIVNQGQSVQFSVSNCSDLKKKWSFTSLDTATVHVVPTLTGAYSVQCQKREMQCSSEKTSVQIKVIDDCSDAVILVKGTDDLINKPNKLQFKSKTVVTANNGIKPSSNIEYKAANSISLNPGFSAEPGVVFKAEIKNCP